MSAGPVSLLPAVARKLGFGVLAVWAVFTVTFAFVTLTPDPGVAETAWIAARDPTLNATKEIAAYREARNLNDPVLQRYVKWLFDVATLDWGTSFALGRPVTDLPADRLAATAAHAVPAVLLAPLAGVSLGGYLAVRGGGRVDRAVTLAGYAGLGAPNFRLAAVLPVALYAALGVGGTEAARAGTAPVGPVSGRTMNDVVFPAAVLSTGPFAAQLRQARAEAPEYVGEEFVKTVRAKGASRLRVLGHVVRNAAPPLLSLSVSDLLAALVVNVFVLEQVFFVEGVGKLGYFAIVERDLPLILGVSTFLVLLGVATTVASDLLQLVADPRTRAEEA